MRNDKFGIYIYIYIYIYLRKRNDFEKNVEKIIYKHGLMSYPAQYKLEALLLRNPTVSEVVNINSYVESIDCGSWTGEVW